MGHSGKNSRGARVGTRTRYGGIRLGYKKGTNPDGSRKMMTEAESIAHRQQQDRKFQVDGNCHWEGEE